MRAEFFLPDTRRPFGCLPLEESAIRDLLSFYANSEAELPRELAPPMRAWIRGYVGSESELILRHLYDRISMSFTTRAVVSLARRPRVLLRVPSFIAP